MKTNNSFLFGLMALISVLFSSHITSVSAQNNYICGDFIIRRIDLYDSMYMIYAQRNDSIYKIYSRQEKTPPDGKILMIGNTYHFCLVPLFMKSALRSSLIVGRFFQGRTIYYRHQADYCVHNVFFSNNICGKRVYDRRVLGEYDEYKYRKELKEPKIKLPKDIDKIRPGNAANPKR